MLMNVFEGILIPAIKQSENMGTLSFVPAVVGFWIGILFLLALDHLIRIFMLEVIRQRLGFLENYQTMIFMILSCLLSGKTSCMKHLLN